MNPNSRKVIKTGANEYQVLKPNPLYPNEGEIWHSVGKKYTERGITALIAQNPQELRFEFEDSELINILQESKNKS